MMLKSKAKAFDKLNRFNGSKIKVKFGKIFFKSAILFQDKSLMDIPYF